MGLGTLSAAAMPALAVVSCGSDDKATASFSKTSFVGDQFLTKTNATKIKDFLTAVGKSTNQYNNTWKNYGQYEIKANLTKTNYEIAYKSVFPTDSGMQSKFAEILKANKGDVNLAVHVINFTYATINGMKLALMGIDDSTLKSKAMDPTADLSDFSTFGTLTPAQTKILNDMIQEISKGSLDAKTIADGVMGKFRGEDPIWSMDMISATYTASGNVLTLGAESLASTMGGIHTVEAIITAAGYIYKAS